MDELRIVLKRDEDIRAFQDAKKALVVEGNVEALRKLIRAYHEHMEWEQYKHRVDTARDLMDAEEEVKELREELELRERYIRHADERLSFHMLRRNPGKVIIPTPNVRVLNQEVIFPARHNRKLL